VVVVIIIMVMMIIVGMVWSPTKDVRREVAKEEMDPIRKKEKRPTTKDLV
jgi:hypothetical protein